MLEQLYEKSLIPIIVANENEDIIIPEKPEHADQYFNKSYLKNVTEKGINLRENNDYFFVSFYFKMNDEKKCIAVIGPCNFIDLTRNNYSINRSKELSKLTLYENKKRYFIKFVKLIFSILNNKLPKLNQLKWIKGKKSSQTFIEAGMEKNLNIIRYEDIDMDSIELEKRLIESVRRNEPESVIG
ncbi:hypothetical protein IAE51_05330 [Lactococcus sp. S64]|uniref:hypothetical protein n=1 Tax=Lactococcus sp. S64 TaxID=2767459 RepID=UPI001906A28A|nr:hypothetical protein [Lactococcus sp. S64]MBK0083326.1 hypothetical protein [Lactococcus sp. S64]